MTRLAHHVVIAVAGFFFIQSAVRASQPAFDTAGDSAYNAGWTQGSNGGFGWGGGWSIINPQNVFIGTSTANGFRDPENEGDINSPRSSLGRAWGLGGDSIARRPFSGPLTLGQTFSIDLDDKGFFIPNQNERLTLLDPNGVGVIIFQMVPQGYAINYAGATGVPLTQHGIHLTFTKNEGSVDFSITPYVPGSVPTLFNLRYAGDVSGVEINLYHPFGMDNQTSYYANNMAITPEPSGTLVAALIGAAAALSHRRRVSV